MNAHNPPEMTIASIARYMLDSSGGDLNKAAVALDAYAATRPRLSDEYRMLGVRTALAAAVQSQRATVLREYRMPKEPHRESAGARATRAMYANPTVRLRCKLMDMEIQINNVAKALRNWTGVEIAAHGEAQLASAQSGARNAQFLILVGRAAGKKKIDSLDDGLIERLHREAMESA